MIKNKNFQFNSSITHSYNQEEFKLVYKNDVNLKPYQKTISIRNNWKKYAEEFEKYAPNLETSSNLYQIDTLKFLKNSKIQPIFLSKECLKIKIPKIQPNKEKQISAKTNVICVNLIPNTLFNVKKHDSKINLKELNGLTESIEVSINKDVFEKTSRPLTYYLGNKLKKQHI